MLQADTINRLLRLARTEEMGHGARMDSADLGLGWIYYTVARLYEPQHVFVVGSYRGFVPAIFGLACRHNRWAGKVSFLDPSLADDFWRDPDAVKAHFAALGAPNVIHISSTSQEFVRTPAYARLDPIDLLFIDGLHTEEQARFEHHAFMPRKGGLTMFHDSRSQISSGIYGKPYTHTVHRYIDKLRADPLYDVIEIPFAQGVAVVSRKDD